MQVFTIRYECPKQQTMDFLEFLDQDVADKTLVERRHSLREKYTRSRRCRQCIYVHQLR